MSEVKVIQVASLTWGYLIVPYFLRAQESMKRCGESSIRLNLSYCIWVSPLCSYGQIMENKLLLGMQFSRD